MSRGKKLKVAESSQQIKTQGKAFAPVSVGIGKNMKAFETRDGVFYHDTLRSQCVVDGFGFWAEWLLFAAFDGQFATLMVFLESLITRIGQHGGVGMHPSVRALK